MKPKFKTLQAWEQAELLMQPALIRVLDNIRKEIEQSSWNGSYQEIQTPYPGYLLCLTQGEQSVTVDIWELCFQVCFVDYPPAENHEASSEVEIDLNLLDDTGDVDWQSLETKAQQLVKEIFANLPV